MFAGAAGHVEEGSRSGVAFPDEGVELGRVALVVLPGVDGVVETLRPEKHDAYRMLQPVVVQPPHGSGTRLVTPGRGPTLSSRWPIPTISLPSASSTGLRVWTESRCVETSSIRGIPSFASISIFPSQRPLRIASRWWFSYTGTGTPIGNSGVLAVAWCVGIGLFGYLWARRLFNGDPSG